MRKELIMLKIEKALSDNKFQKVVDEYLDAKSCRDNEDVEAGVLVDEYGNVEIWVSSPNSVWHLPFYIQLEEFTDRGQVVGYGDVRITDGGGKIVQENIKASVYKMVNKDRSITSEEIRAYLDNICYFISDYPELEGYDDVYDYLEEKNMSEEDWVDTHRSDMEMYVEHWRENENDEEFWEVNCQGDDDLCDYIIKFIED